MDDLTFDQSSLVGPFSLLNVLVQDNPMTEIWSERSQVSAWLTFEAELASSQAEMDVFPSKIADQIRSACRYELIDSEALWGATRVVGYPILPLVRQITARLDPPADGRVHYGATTQDAMDTGQALILVAACHRLEALLVDFGNALERLVLAHRATIMPARTHGQQAVPTTFGTKLAVFLSQATQLLADLRQVRTRVGVVSLWGAGGTAAALGSRAPEIRQRLATRLGLACPALPNHVDRLAIGHYSQVCGMLAAVATRFAREVIDLARTEIAEVSEPAGQHAGASSTMPQKANPVESEAIVGAGVAAGSLVSALARAMEAGHERSAGEWQIEWAVLPQLSVMVAGAIAAAAELAAGLEVDAVRMAKNLNLDHGLVMAEAAMIRLAENLGREAAHDLVTEVASKVRAEGGSFLDALRQRVGDTDFEVPLPADYLGEVDAICDTAVSSWRQATKENT